ncbi:hypothetical protein FQN54_009604 [Arachnomyces sp. PD_36]|nr:hypothetical protein FQN54_009604 [Arachnomyces sp. PD_36]
MVKFYFLNRPTNAETMRQYIALAYQTAQDQKIYPRAVLVRSGIHGTTTVDGKPHQKDPKGDHLTICFKDSEMLAKGTHVASHGYVDLRTSSNIREATHSPEKPDATKKRGGREVWPTAEALPLETELAFGHVPEEAELLKIVG